MSSPAVQKRKRNRSKSHVVKGFMRLQLIPAKDGAFRVHHPMVTLFFHFEGGDELNIYAKESADAPVIYEHFKSLLEPSTSDGPGRYIRNLSLPS